MFRLVFAAAFVFASAAAAQQDLPFRLEDLAIGLPEQGAPLAVPGPHEVVAEPAHGAPRLLVYRPASLAPFPSQDTLPVVVWGNGGCMADGGGFAAYLSTIASHGFLVVTTAPVDGDPQARTTSADLIAAIDWAEGEAARDGSPLAGKVATGAVAVMGQSCGGNLAIEAAADPRVATLGAWNSGVWNTGEMRTGDGVLLVATTKDDLARIHSPTLYVNGGEIDPATVNAADDVERIDQAPVFFGSRRNGGHSGTYAHPGGGEFANVAVAWLTWRLKHDADAGAMFVGEDCGLCANPDWQVRSKGFD
jgi:dienelactone hydrolase